MSDCFVCSIGFQLLLPFQYSNRNYDPRRHVTHNNIYTLIFCRYVFSFFFVWVLKSELFRTQEDEPVSRLRYHIKLFLSIFSDWAWLRKVRPRQVLSSPREVYVYIKDFWTLCHVRQALLKYLMFGQESAFYLLINLSFTLDNVYIMRNVYFGSFKISFISVGNSALTRTRS